MTINSISFGKVTLIKTPLTTAAQIAQIANGDGEKKLDKQIKEIISDTKEGKAYAYSFNPSVERSYIFSGKEGKDFQESYQAAVDSAAYIKAFYGKSNFAKTVTDITWKNHEQNALKLISSATERTITDVEYDKKGNIQSVNIVA